MSFYNTQGTDDEGRNATSYTPTTDGEDEQFVSESFNRTKRHANIYYNTTENYKNMPRTGKKIEKSSQKLIKRNIKFMTQIIHVPKLFI